MLILWGILIIFSLTNVLIKLVFHLLQKMQILHQERKIIELRKTIKVVSERIICLPIISKIFGKLLCKQVPVFMELLLLKYLRGFRKGLSAKIVFWECKLNGKDPLIKVKFLFVFKQTSKKYLMSHELTFLKLNVHEFSLVILPTKNKN